MRIVAVYEDCGWRGLEGMEVRCEGGDEVAFGAVAVEADGEVLGELEGPLGEGAGVEGVEV